MGFHRVKHKSKEAAKKFFLRFNRNINGIELFKLAIANLNYRKG